MSAVASSESLPGGGKVGSLDQVARLAQEARARGHSVVLAHGVFDLLHLGHVRHLKEAAGLGDILVVSVTADRFVNKGPGRPVFAQAMRAEMLAALEQVDWVLVNDAATAEPVISGLRPDVYVKGPDYADASQDVTGGITTERRLVEAHGGRIVFTDDVTFSSSSLINQHLGVYDTDLREYLAGARSRDMLSRLLRLVDSVQNYRVLLVGDTIIDEYLYVEPMTKPPKENIIATLFKGRDVFAGGVIAAANHAAALCKQVDVLTCLGTRDSCEDIVRRAAKPNVGLHLLHLPDRPTVRKTRYVESGYMRKLFEVYHMDDTPIVGWPENDLNQRVAAMAPGYDVVIVTDFGHGMLTRPIQRTLQEKSRFLAVNTQTNSANFGFNPVTRYDRADYICIDTPEARLAVGDKNADVEVVAAELLPGRIDCPRVMITRGQHGCTAYDRESGVGRVPGFTKTVIDTIGAGDAFLAVTAPLAATGAPMEEVGFVGNAAGAIKVGILGHQKSVEKAPLVKFITALLK